MLMGGRYLKRDRFEGSQAMPASPSGGVWARLVFGISPLYDTDRRENAKELGRDIDARTAI
jgi:hypothetical protein